MSISIITHPEIKISVPETSIPALNHALGPSMEGTAVGRVFAGEALGERELLLLLQRVSVTGEMEPGPLLHDLCRNGFDYK